MSHSELEIEFPDWVPSPVQRVAAQIISWGVPLAIVRRFGTDSRMEDIWRDLNKRDRDGYQPTNRPTYPTTLPRQCESWATLASALREHAAKERKFGREDEARDLENRANFAERRDRLVVSVVPPPDIQHEYGLAVLFTQAIARFDEQGETATLKELEDRVRRERKNGRHDIADAFEHVTDDPIASRFIVTRRRTDARIEAYVEAMAIVCRDLFGHDMPGIIATLVNVAFERTDFSRDRVRAILKRPPAARSA